jgi:uncharacterized membrane protein YkoI
MAIRPRRLDVPERRPDAAENPDAPDTVGRGQPHRTHLEVLMKKHVIISRARSATLASLGLAAGLALSAGLGVAAAGATEGAASDAASALSEAEIVAQLEAKGYEVREIEREDDDELEVYAVQQGQLYELEIDARTGEILEIEREDD